MNKLSEKANNTYERYLSKNEPEGGMEHNMNNEKSCCGNAKNVIKGITCDVITCQYHTGDGHCTAGHIKVGQQRNTLYNL